MDLYLCSLTFDIPIEKSFSINTTELIRKKKANRIYRLIQSIYVIEKKYLNSQDYIEVPQFYFQVY